ncbi:MAG: hypothetical protein F6J98_44530 [Moorea sp. SIO4G2]|nr:hypothetical protein [Moorena sp. SIO4G2]
MFPAPCSLFLTHLIALGIPNPDSRLPTPDSLLFPAISKLKTAASFQNTVDDSHQLNNSPKLA